MMTALSFCVLYVVRGFDENESDLAMVSLLGEGRRGVSGLKRMLNDVCIR